MRSYMILMSHPTCPDLSTRGGMESSSLNVAPTRTSSVEMTTNPSVPSTVTNPGRSFNTTMPAQRFLYSVVTTVRHFPAGGTPAPPTTTTRVVSFSSEQHTRMVRMNLPHGGHSDITEEFHLIEEWGDEVYDEYSSSDDDSDWWWDSDEDAPDFERGPVVRSQLNGANGEVTGTDDHDNAARNARNRVHRQHQRPPGGRAGNGGHGPPPGQPAQAAGRMPLGHKTENLSAFPDFGRTQVYASVAGNRLEGDFDALHALKDRRLRAAQDEFEINEMANSGPPQPGPEPTPQALYRMGARGTSYNVNAAQLAIIDVPLGDRILYSDIPPDDDHEIAYTAAWPFLVEFARNMWISVFVRLVAMAIFHIADKYRSGWLFESPLWLLDVLVSTPVMLLYIFYPILLYLHSISHTFVQRMCRALFHQPRPQLDDQFVSMPSDGRLETQPDWCKGTALKYYRHVRVHPGFLDYLYNKEFGVTPSLEHTLLLHRTHKATWRKWLPFELYRNTLLIFQQDRQKQLYDDRRHVGGFSKVVPPIT